MNSEKLEAMYQADLDAAACGCGAACPHCKQHLEMLKNLPEDEHEEFRAYCISAGAYDN